MPERGRTGRAPGRVNLIGEHVDYVGGPVLPCAIELFTTVHLEPASRWRVTSKVPGGLPYVRAVARRLGAGPQGVEVSSTVPAGAGLSSSAALLVATCVALAPDLDGVQAALLCQAAERAATGVGVGIMDQFAAALGRAGSAILLDSASLEHRHVPLPGSVVLGLIDSGIRRHLADTPYNLRRDETAAGEPSRIRHVESEIARVREFVVAMENQDLPAMGRLLRESHRSLRDDYEVSTPAVDDIVEVAGGAPGCLGARMTGAGFGGSILALVQAGTEDRFRATLRRPVLFCRTADGAYTR